MGARDTLTDDQVDEAAYRDRATIILDGVAQRAREVLRKAGIPLNIFFVVPAAGDAILTLGAAVNQEKWQEIRSAVSSIVRRSVGLEPAQCRQVICAIDRSDDSRC